MFVCATCSQTPFGNLRFVENDGFHFVRSLLKLRMGNLRHQVEEEFVNRGGQLPSEFPQEGVGCLTKKTSKCPTVDENKNGRTMH
jgi:hypothetical protein